jgi:hypothetical protein
VGYLLGLGDRHPSNLMLDRYSGKLLHIDFGDCFEASMHREKFPEKVPFRLTRMMVKGARRAPPRACVCAGSSSFSHACAHMRMLSARHSPLLARCPAESEMGTEGGMSDTSRAAFRSSSYWVHICMMQPRLLPHSALPRACKR